MHTNLTKEQRIGLKKVFDRTPIVTKDPSIRSGARFMTYREFRRTVQAGTFGCVMVRWAGMWLGIESDGYTHS